MGTSGSSRGPRSGAPLVPPGTPPPPDQPNQPPIPIPVAPPRRFQATRTHLGKFAESGSVNDLRRGLGHYAQTGLSGSSAATARMARTATTAGQLYGVLSALSEGAAIPPDVALNTAQFAGKSQSEIADQIADALRPVDGTQDTDAARDSVARALSELLQETPNADLTDLATEQINHVVESYIAHDLAHRIELDVGKAVLEKAPNYAEGAARLEEIKAFVRQEVARAFRARAENAGPMTRQNAAAMSSAILRDTFSIFESYL